MLEKEKESKSHFGFLSFFHPFQARVARSPDGAFALFPEPNGNATLAISRNAALYLAKIEKVSNIRAVVGSAALGPNVHGGRVEDGVSGYMVAKSRVVFPSVREMLLYLHSPKQVCVY